MKLDRYVLGEVAGPFAGGLLFFIFLFLMSQVLRLAELFIVHGVPFGVLMKMVSLLSISFLPTALPIAFLIAVLMAFGRLSSDSELVAMKASGISLNRLARPVGAIASLVVVLSIFLNLEWVPWSGKLFKSTLLRMSNTKAVSTIREGAFTTGFFDLLIFADEVDSDTNRMRRVFVYDERNPKNPLTVVADSGEIIPVKTESELAAAAMLKLYNGSIHRNDLEEGTYQKADFGEYSVYLSITEGQDAMVTKPEMIPYSELKEKISKSDPRSYEGREFRGELYKRFAVAISPLIFVFLGIGFGTVRTRAVRAGAVLIAFSTAVTYWVLQTVGTISVQKGMLPPLLAMQLPNIVVAVAAWVGFRKAQW
jgi:lipopolysaccharide export system permease protein